LIDIADKLERVLTWLRMKRPLFYTDILTCVGLPIFGEQSVGKMLVLSQVVLSLQLPFAVIPLILFTGNRNIMGRFANQRWLQTLAWMVALVITSLNIWLLGQIFSEIVN
jgi:manganese transport protein